MKQPDLGLFSTPPLRTVKTVRRVIVPAPPRQGHTEGNKFVMDDGGRAAAGYKGEAGGCVCRSIAIATGKPYQEVYDALQPKLASTRSRRALVETSLKAWRATATEIGRDLVARPCIARATGRNAGR